MDSRTSRAGGCLLAVSIMAGVAIGAFRHQTSIGFLAGLGVGLALLGLVWLRERR
jgi:hypothetical protein